MGYIGNSTFTGVITSSDSIDAGVVEISDLSAAAQAGFVMQICMVLKRLMEQDLKKKI